MAMNSASTVFVVDGNAVEREALRPLVESLGCAFGAFRTANLFLKAISPGRPGCVIVDARLPGMSGLELRGALAERGVWMPIIVTAGNADVPMAVEAMKAGAFDFIEKPFRAQHMLGCVRRAIAQDLRARELDAQREESRVRLAMLSRRERQVLDLVCAGMSTATVAGELGLRPKTVEAYRSHISKKMKARNVADLVRMHHWAGEEHAGERWAEIRCDLERQSGSHELFC